MTVPTVVALVDPLCGWCFGSVDALDEARAALGDDVWRVTSGHAVAPREDEPDD